MPDILEMIKTLLDIKTIQMLLEGIKDTLYMTLTSTIVGYVLGLPLGIILNLTRKDGLHPNAVIYFFIDIIQYTI